MCTNYLKVIALIVFCCQILTTVQAKKNRIVGGVPTTIDKAKYLVSLRDSQGGFFCGGSLVKRRYVITAAHCLVNRKASDIFVHAGATYLLEPGIKRSVVQMRVPKRFSMDTYLMDIAVLKLDGPLTGENVSLIPLCSHPIPVNSTVRIFGWGKEHETAMLPSNQLRTTTVSIVGQQSCRQSYRSELNITRTMFCAANKSRDSCSGDSGGPLIHKGELCGVVSFGTGCARVAFPGVYTDIKAAKKFLDLALKD